MPGFTGCGRISLDRARIPAFLEQSQGSPCARQARHQGADGDSERVSRFLIWHALDGHEVKHRPLLVRQPQEGLPDLLQPDRIVLTGWKMGLRKFGCFSDAPSFSL